MQQKRTEKGNKSMRFTTTTKITLGDQYRSSFWTSNTRRVLNVFHVEVMKTHLKHNARDEIASALPSSPKPEPVILR